MTPLTSADKIDTANQGTSKFSVLWLLLKGIPIEISYIGKLYYTLSTTFIQKITPLTTKKVDFIAANLREYEAICKKALTCESGDQMELFDEKNQRSKIS
jgi:hypothetical protein